MKKYVVILVLAAAVMFVMWGCDDSKKAHQTDTLFDGCSMDDIFGGFDTEDVSPDTLSAAFAGDESDGESYDDGIKDDPDFQDTTSRPDRSELIVKFEWGRFYEQDEPRPGDSTKPDDGMPRPVPFDWTGSLHSSNPDTALLLERTITFEQDDYILERTDPRLIEWVSHTESDRDGIVVKWIVPELPIGLPDEPGDDGSSVPGNPGDSGGIRPPVDPDDPDSHTDPDNPGDPDTPGPDDRYMLILSLRILNNGLIPINLSDIIGCNQKVLYSDGMGNALTVTAFLVNPRPRRAHGFLAGKWNDGMFRGRWCDANHTTMGYLYGIYGVKSDGHKVFFGKYVDTDGKFIGILFGRWGEFPGIQPDPEKDDGDDSGGVTPPGDDNSTRPPDDDDDNGIPDPDYPKNGWFEGCWVDASFMPSGSLQGIWFEGPVSTRDSDGGYFGGTWRSNITSDGDSEDPVTP
jgi:hypothetical protein